MKLKVRNLKKSFNEKVLFENLNFEVEDGDVLGLLGNSGIGKTTLMNILLGIEDSDGGSVEYSDRPKFSVVFQENLLFEEKTVLENLEFVQRDEKINLNLLTELELGEYANSKAKVLSGGMKRRLSLVRSVAKEGNIFMMDEAIREVDTNNRKRMIEFLMKHKGVKPLIYITHDELDLKLMRANKIVRLS
ncbi:NitT/TauT family transport system ATP-binding protein [Anaerosphaera aminiphila DSM 21120]|uniref:NitT/TauT family transport system ATP-binding protein n=1 Tax=Anaerosphaera aminiphila DSM 21120 TaxID=1120995 RepID=A0A1M5Q977_9FIRM|nr:ATP-binding cassette domain-containing protein [Anaerosphaera aminiphila]SHH10704.1 NitT/TauT family transport system ATP-binding protein [Anaerosphaera aminiphila DSM 21120]